MINDLERQTGALFGSLWTSLSDEHYRDSVELFTKRAIANQFDLGWLKGKKCLDAGCGSGRYSVALALHGVDSVTAVDVSESGLKEAKRRAIDFSQITFQQASVLDLPFDDATFDFVWSAGVIHHTADFDRALSELTRVLRPGGGEALSACLWGRRFALEGHQGNAPDRRRSRSRIPRCSHWCCRIASK